jgi:3-oxoacyl-[acyl-carrier-protein] synthase-3
MARATANGIRIRGIGTCAPRHRYDNRKDSTDFTPEEIRKVTGMAGVERRPVAGEGVCSSDLCAAAAEQLLGRLGWAPGSVDLLVMITQTPDYFLPQTASVVHRRLGLGENCAAFDIGLGCSGYPYGLWVVASLMNSGGVRRALLLHGDTPARYSDRSDRSVALLFGDAGSATALERTDAGEPRAEWGFVLHTDSSGLEDMIIEGGGFRDRFPTDARRHFVRMQGANVFNFTLKRLPPLIRSALDLGRVRAEDIDYFILHQSNQFIMKHLAKKVEIPPAKMPIILRDFGNTGGSSIPLTVTQGGLTRPTDRPLKLLLVGYGVGLSWASALVDLAPAAILTHVEWEATA